MEHPYTERFNHQQYSDFSGDTGVAISLLPGQAPTELKGTTLFPGQGGLGRHLPTDWKNIAPRLGFAYAFNSKTVFRGGAGIYYGLNPATNFQYTGTAFSSSGNIFFHSGRLQFPIRDVLESISEWSASTTRHDCREESQLGIFQCQQFGNRGGAQRQHLPVEYWNTAAMAF